MRFSSIFMGAVAVIGGVNALSELPDLMSDITLDARADPVFKKYYPLGLTVVKQLTAYITQTAIDTNTINVSFTASNPVPIPLVIDYISAISGVNGEVYATFTKTFSPALSLPASGTLSVPKFGPVILTQGAINTLPITDLGYLDVQQLNLSGSLYGKIPIQLSYIFQNKVPATYDVDLSQKK